MLPADDDSLADLLFDLEPQSPEALAAATGRPVADVIREMSARTLYFERTAPLDGGRCWWWRLAPDARREREARLGIGGSRRARRARESASGGAAAAGRGAAPAARPPEGPADGPARAADRGDHPRPGGNAPRGLADRAGRAQAQPAAPATASAPPDLTDRVLALLERRHRQGLGGATAAWLAEQLRAKHDDVHRTLTHDPRFDRIACGDLSWWWSAAVIALREAAKG